MAVEYFEEWLPLATSSQKIFLFCVSQGELRDAAFNFHQATERLYHCVLLVMTFPEAVFATASVSPGRKTLRFETPDFGSFSFHPLAIADYHFLTGVDRVEMGKLIAFVLEPLDQAVSIS